MYEAVHVSSPERTTPARYALTAARHGYDGVVLRGAGGEWDHERLAAAAARYDVEVIAGAQLTVGDRSAAGGIIAAARPTVDVLCVAGQTAGMNRFIAEQERVDVLAQPLANGNDLSHTVAKAARDHGVFVELDLGPVLRASGDRRSSSIRELDRLYTVLDHYEVPYVVSANAASHLELRAWRELGALGDVIGLPSEAIERGLTAWGEIAERSRRVRDDTFIEPGVRGDPDEADDR